MFQNPVSFPLKFKFFLFFFSSSSFFRPLSPFPFRIQGNLPRKNIIAPKQGTFRSHVFSGEPNKDKTRLSPPFFLSKKKKSTRIGPNSDVRTAPVQKPLVHTLHPKIYVSVSLQFFGWRIRALFFAWLENVVVGLKEQGRNRTREHHL